MGLFGVAVGGTISAVIQFKRNLHEEKVKIREQVSNYASALMEFESAAIRFRETKHRFGDPNEHQKNLLSSIVEDAFKAKEICDSRVLAAVACGDHRVSEFVRDVHNDLQKHSQNFNAVMLDTPTRHADLPSLTYLSNVLVAQVSPRKKELIKSFRNVGEAKQFLTE